MQTTVETPRATAESAIYFTEEFGPYAWYLDKQYMSFKKCINNEINKKYIHPDTIKLEFESMIKKLAKHASKVYNLALSRLPLEAFKHVPKNAAGTLLNAINYGVFKVDGQKKSFRDFYYYCWSIMSAIDTEVARMK